MVVVGEEGGEEICLAFGIVVVSVVLVLLCLGSWGMLLSLPGKGCGEDCKGGRGWRMGCFVDEGKRGGSDVSFGGLRENGPGSDTDWDMLRSSLV